MWMLRAEAALGRRRRLSLSLLYHHCGRQVGEELGLVLKSARMKAWASEIACRHLLVDGKACWVRIWSGAESKDPPKSRPIATRETVREIERSGSGKSGSR